MYIPIFLFEPDFLYSMFVKVLLEGRERWGCTSSIAPFFFAAFSRPGGDGEREERVHSARGFKLFVTDEEFAHYKTYSEARAR